MEYVRGDDSYNDARDAPRSATAEARATQMARKEAPTRVVEAET